VKNNDNFIAVLEWSYTNDQDSFILLVASLYLVLDMGNAVSNRSAFSEVSTFTGKKGITKYCEAVAKCRYSNVFFR